MSCFKTLGWYACGVKLLTVVGVLTFMNMVGFVLGLDGHERSLI